MATCWHCESFAEDPAAECGFCGATRLGSKPKWIAALDALPTPEDQTANFARWYALWGILLAALGLLYWPWWAAAGAVFISLFVAAPTALASLVLTEQAARLWRSARPKVLNLSQRGPFALEEQTRARLHEDQEAFDTLISLINRERRCQDLMPVATAAGYRKHKLLPVFGKLVRLSASILLELEVHRLINRCEQICDGAEDCEYRELNRRYEQLESMQRKLGEIRNRWSEYLLTSVAKPEFAATAEPSGDGFETQLPPTSTVLSREDVAGLRRANDTVRQLRQMLHQAQELQLLRATKPLAGHAVEMRHGGPPVSSMFMLLKQIQAPNRLSELEQEYQRIVAEQRVVQDTPSHPSVSNGDERIGTLHPSFVSKDFKNWIDAPVILSNSLPLSVVPVANPTLPSQCQTSESTASAASDATYCAP